MALYKHRPLCKEDSCKTIFKISTVFRTQGTKQKQTSHQNNELHMKANT